MSTYAQCQTKGNSRPVFWLYISGIPYVFSDGIAKASLFGSEYEAGLTFKNLLMEPEFSFARSIEILTGKGQTSGFEIKLLDAKGGSEPDGFLTWLLFGKNRSSIARTRLTADVEKHIGGAGHNWSVEDNSGFAASGYAYCGLETISYTSKTGTTEFTTVYRSQYKCPATCHKTAEGQTLYPYVTDHPIEWEGRIVTLFQGYLDANGVLSHTTGESPLIDAHRIRGIISGISYEAGVWTITCKGIENVLDKPLLSKTAKSRLVQSRIRIDEDNVVVCRIDQRCSPDGINHHTAQYPVILDSGTYDLETFILTINEKIVLGLTDTHGGTDWYGQLSLSLNPDSLTVHFVQSAVATEVCDLEIIWDENYMADPWHHISSAEYWRLIGIPLDDTPVTSDGVLVEQGSEHCVSLPRGMPTIQVDLWAEDIIVAISDGAEDSPIDSYVVGDYVRITSNSGDSYCRIHDKAGELVWLDRAPTDLNWGSLIHQGTPESPIWLEKVGFAMSGRLNPVTAPLGHSLLQFLLSTGVAGFNHPDYDTLSEGTGIEVPHWSLNAGSDSETDSLINVTAFEDFFRDVEPWVEKIWDVITEPTNAMEYVCQRLAFFGGYLIIENGQISCRRGLFTMQHQETAAITTNGLLHPNQTIQTGGIQTIKGIKWSTNYQSHTQKFQTVYVVTLWDSRNNDSFIEIQDKGIWTTADKMMALGAEILSDFAGVPVVYTISLDRSFADLEPGSVVSFTDDGKIPNPDGTLGHTATKMLVLSAETNYKEATSSVTLLQSFNNRSGFAASGWIESFSGSTVTLTGNFFSAVADGLDASRFGVGDKVRIQKVNPYQTGTEPDSNTAQTGLTVVSITGNNIVLDTAIATYSGAWVSGTTGLVLTHDPFQTTGQTTKAKAWGWVGAATGVIGGTAVAVYQW